VNEIRTKLISTILTQKVEIVNEVDFSTFVDAVDDSDALRRYNDLCLP
jgi:hypothetical protein